MPEAETDLGLPRVAPVASPPAFDPGVASSKNSPIYCLYVCWRRPGVLQLQVVPQTGACTSPQLLLLLYSTVQSMGQQKRDMALSRDWTWA